MSVKGKGQAHRTSYDALLIKLTVWSSHTLLR